MEPERLLAKRRDKDQKQAPTIAWHTKHVLDCAKRLLELRAENAIDAMGLAPPFKGVLERIVIFAAWLHDIGKCLSSFQRIIQGGLVQSPYRHEAASWYITTQILDVFIASYVPDKVERWMIAVCVAGHHRRFHRDDDDGAIRDFVGEDELYLNHKDFREWIELIPVNNIIGELPSFNNKTLSANYLYKAMSKSFIDYDEADFPVLSDGQKKIISLAKSFLIAADVSASALSKHSIKFDWVEEKLGNRASSEKLKTLLDAKLRGKALREFQEAIAQSNAPWTFLKAGCGTGKTAAACAWAERNHQGRQLWLTYPTTGTATEGFKDYVMGADLEGSLQHSRANLDIELKLIDISEENDENELPQRDIALRGWGADTVVATVDTILGIVQNHRAGYYAYPGILKGALVFDEIHSYDNRLFASLLRFLEAHPNIPCLFMTASLQQHREQALKELHHRLFKEELKIIEGPKDLETIPRYYQSKEDPWAAIEHCRQQRGKVLWVSNTVDRSMCIVDEAEKKGIKPLLYHSRYKYIDRVARHKDIIDAFKEENDDFVFASTTQVAEMSLDISADLLITDIAPIPAMIQRLGRLNRWIKTNSPVRPFIVIYDKQRENAPYRLDDLEYTKEWLKSLSEQISQQDLVEYWPQQKEEHSRIFSYWLDEPFWTQKTSLREASSGMSIILEEDTRKKPISAYQISMPPRKTASMEKYRGLWVAKRNQVCYDEFRGASWLKK